MSQRSNHSKEPIDIVTALLVGGMVVAVVGCVVLLWMTAKLNNTPRWWKSLDEIQTSEQVGIELENRMTSALTRLRPVDEANWSVAIHQDQINSWLAHRLMDTLDSFGELGGSNGISEVRMMIQPTKLMIGAELSHAHGSSVVWIVVDLSVNESGEFVVDIQRAKIGTAPIPARWVSRYMTSAQLGDAKVDLGDGREVRIRGLRTGDGRLEFALRTQPSE